MKDISSLPPTPPVESLFSSAYQLGLGPVENATLTEEEKNSNTEEGDSSETLQNQSILMQKVLRNSGGNYQQDGSQQGVSEATSENTISNPLGNEILEKVDGVVDTCLNELFQNISLSPQQQGQIRDQVSTLAQGFSVDFKSTLEEMPANFGEVDLPESFSELMAGNLMAALYTALHNATLAGYHGQEVMAESSLVDAQTAEKASDKYLADFKEFRAKQAEQEAMSWLSKLFSKVAGFITGFVQLVIGVVMLVASAGALSVQAIACIVAGGAEIATQIATLIIEAFMKEPAKSKALKILSWVNTAVQIICAVATLGLRPIGWVARKLGSLASKVTLNTLGNTLKALGTAMKSAGSYVAVSKGLQYTQVAGTITDAAASMSSAGLQVAENLAGNKTDHAKSKYSKSAAENELISTRANISSDLLQKLSRDLVSIMNIVVDAVKVSSDGSAHVARNTA